LYIKAGENFENTPKMPLIFLEIGGGGGGAAAAAYFSRFCENLQPDHASHPL
jgi:hypothetical protein